MKESTGRRVYLDWVRGVAVLVMIQAHVLDSWTRADVRDTSAFAWSMIVAGFGAPGATGATDCDHRRDPLSEAGIGKRP